MWGLMPCSVVKIVSLQRSSNWIECEGGKGRNLTSNPELSLQYSRNIANGSGGVGVSTGMRCRMDDVLHLTSSFIIPGKIKIGDDISRELNNSKLHRRGGKTPMTTRCYPTLFSCSEEFSHVYVQHSLRKPVVIFIS